MAIYVTGCLIPVPKPVQTISAVMKNGLLSTPFAMQTWLAVTNRAQSSKRYSPDETTCSMPIFVVNKAAALPQSHRTKKGNTDSRNRGKLKRDACKIVISRPPVRDLVGNWQANTKQSLHPGTPNRTTHNHITGHYTHITLHTIHHITLHTHHITLHTSHYTTHITLHYTHRTLYYTHHITLHTSHYITRIIIDT